MSLDDDRQLLVLSVQNRERKFQEPPRWEGLARLSRVMNNLVGKTTGHHTTDGASFACGARKHFGTNSEGGTVTTYKPNTHGKRLSPKLSRILKMPLPNHPKSTPSTPAWSSTHDDREWTTVRRKKKNVREDRLFDPADFPPLSSDPQN